MKADLTLTKGSRYRIISGGGQEAMVTVGEFLGYVGLGNDQAIAVRLDSDEIGGECTRLIPVKAIFAIDIIEGKEAVEEESEAVRVYFV